MKNAGWIMVAARDLSWLAMGYRIASLATKRPGTSLIHKRVCCPIMQREAEVEFLGEGGVPSAVKCCSLLGDLKIIHCRQRCFEQATGQELDKPLKTTEPCFVAPAS